MKFKEFVAWCNERACDGAWGIRTGVACMEIMRQVNLRPFWAREKEWQRMNHDFEIEKLIVQPINESLDRAERKTCENCRKRHTMDCPNSSECYALDDKPFWEGVKNENGAGA